MNVSIEVENNIYDEAHLDFLKCNSYIEYLIQTCLLNQYSGAVQSVVTPIYDYSDVRRIVGGLRYESLKDIHGIMTEMVPQELVSFLGIENFEKSLRHGAYTGFQLDEALKKDLLSGYLNILQDYVHKKEYEHIQKQLIRSKYHVSFISRVVEEDMIGNCFAFPDCIYVNSKHVADLIDADHNLYQFRKNTYGASVALDQLGEILSLKDVDYKDENKMISSVLRQSMLRASFLLMDDEELEKLNFAFHNCIEGEEYLSDHFHDRISEQKIVDCFKAIKKDKNKPLELSLAYRK